ncbi:MAG: hypothetical protein HQL15_01470 [Candidatus Omnitrophica bacterium]|nr:hypothetical protein [Candidatus Omnitrophota bacterium]
MVKIKKKTDPITNIVQGISYGTGLICAKVKNLGKVTKSKEWKETVSKTEDMFKHTGDSIKKSFCEMSESFEEGVQSIAEGAQHAKKARHAVHSNKKLEVKDEESSLVEEVKPVAAPAKKRGRPFAKKTVEAVVDAKEEIKEIKKKKPVAVKAPVMKKVVQEAPQETEEVLLEAPVVKEPKEEVIETSPVIENQEALVVEEKPLLTDQEITAFSFSIEEFKKDGRNPQELIDAIHKNKPEIYIEAPGPMEWLNELLSKGDSGQPLQYSIEETPEIQEAREAFETASDKDKTQKLIKLNRLTLERAYPLKCPKNQILESEQEVEKPSIKIFKQSDSELN